MPSKLFLRLRSPSINAKRLSLRESLGVENHSPLQFGHLSFALNLSTDHENLASQVSYLQDISISPRSPTVTYTLCSVVMPMPPPNLQRSKIRFPLLLPLQEYSAVYCDALRNCNRRNASQQQPQSFP